VTCFLLPAAFILNFKVIGQTPRLQDEIFRQGHVVSTITDVVQHANVFLNPGPLFPIYNSELCLKLCLQYVCRS